MGSGAVWVGSGAVWVGSGAVGIMLMSGTRGGGVAHPDTAKTISKRNNEPSFFMSSLVERNLWSVMSNIYSYKG